MTTQQDIYAAGFENRPPMLNIDNYVPWPSLIIRYAMSRPNGKMIVDSIENGPYVRRMIATPGEPDLHVPVLESFHEQTDEELTETDIKGFGHIAKNCTARPRKRDAAYLQTQLLIAQKEEAGIQLQAEEFDFMAAVDGSTEVHLNDNCYDNEIFNMSTQEEQYTDLLEPIPEPQLVSQNDNHVTSVVPSMLPSGDTVETSFALNEETRAHQETVYPNLVDQVA
nr:hypothetical protein [Tanacetum cinerariifolium]